MRKMEPESAHARPQPTTHAPAVGQQNPLVSADLRQQALGNQALLRRAGLLSQTSSRRASADAIVQRVTQRTGMVIQRAWTDDWGEAVEHTRVEEGKPMVKNDKGQVGPREGYEGLVALFHQICDLLATNFQTSQAFDMIEQFRVMGMKADKKKVQSGIIGQAANVLTEFVSAKDLYDNGTAIRPGAKVAQVGVSQADYGFVEDVALPDLPRDEKNQVKGDAVIAQPPRPPNGFPNNEARLAAYAKTIAALPSKILSDINSKVSSYGTGTYVVVNVMSFHELPNEIDDILPAIKAGIGQMHNKPGKVYLVRGPKAPQVIWP